MQTGGEKIPNRTRQRRLEYNGKLKTWIFCLEIFVCWRKSTEKKTEISGPSSCPPFSPVSSPVAPLPCSSTFSFLPPPPVPMLSFLLFPFVEWQRTKKKLQTKWATLENCYVHAFEPGKQTRIEEKYFSRSEGPSLQWAPFRVHYTSSVFFGTLYSLI